MEMDTAEGSFSGSKTKQILSAVPMKKMHLKFGYMPTSLGNHWEYMQ